MRSGNQSYRFGSSKRNDIVDKKRTELPGPGNYGDIDEFGKTKKSYTFGTKNKDKYNENPGPGSYS